MTHRSRDFLFGFIPSLMLTPLLMALFIHVNFDGANNLWWVVTELFRVGQLSALMAVGAVPNLLLFLYAMNRERLHLGRGVIAATLIYGVVVMILKLA